MYDDELEEVEEIGGAWDDFETFPNGFCRHFEDNLSCEIKCVFCGVTCPEHEDSACDFCTPSEFLCKGLYGTDVSRKEVGGIGEAEIWLYLDDMLNLELALKLCNERIEVSRVD